MRSLTAEISAEAQAALAIDDRDPWAYLVQGNLLNRLSHFDDAKRALHPAVELNPNFPLARAQLASPLANQGAYQEALDSANHAFRLSPNDRNVRAQASIGLMIVDLAARRHVQCIVSARTMIENSPEHIVGHIFLTAARSIQGEVAAAAEARDRLFRVRPGFSLSWMTQKPTVRRGAAREPARRVAQGRDTSRMTATRRLAIGPA